MKNHDFYDWKEERENHSFETLGEALQDWREYGDGKYPVKIYGFDTKKRDADHASHWAMEAAENISGEWDDEYGFEECSDKDAFESDLHDAIKTAIESVIKDRKPHYCELAEVAEIRGEE